MNFFKNLRIASASLLIGATGTASGANFAFNNGDLILGFQATGGDGTTKNVFFNLGSAISHRDNGNLGNLANISTTLSSAFGSNWYSRGDLYFGVIGNLNFAPTSGIGSAGPVNGDPSRTVYVSRSASAPGQSVLWTGYVNNALGVAGNSIASLEGILPTLTANADGSATLDQTTQATSWNNGWTAYNPTPGGSFNTFNGGIQQNFGQIGDSTHVDIQRILATTTGANPSGPVATGTYETTISIGSDGSITAQSASTATPFQTWALTFPALDTEAKRLPDADPDNDGLKNLMEFVLNGNPGISDPSIAPALNAAGTNFILGFNRRDNSEAGSTLKFQYGSDLVGWTDVTIGAAGGLVGSATIAVTEGPGSTPDMISVSVPKTVAAGGKLFGRLKVSQP